ncbi:MAG: RpiR family carbohydrate utilization transcriptional regulator [Candidatus Azotimanducaceae bacterium]|jgi:RpiR family carbohydrate utilization transcriptional regulator
MQHSMIQRIERKLDSLSKSERRVGEWIIANIGRAIDASIMELAGAAEVSEPTVVRFCRSMGVSGFRELRTHLIAAQQRPESYLHHDVSADDAAGDAAMKVLESSIHALVGLRGLISGMPFETAVSAMMAARQLVFVGLGASGHVARDACHKFFRLGMPCSTALDSPTILQKSAIAGADDVYITMSHTGQWPELIEAMKLARVGGATVIALTDPHSPLADQASLVFDCHPAEDTNVFTPMSSRLTQLTLLDALQVALALKMGTAAEENLRLTKLALGPARTTR